MKYLASIAALSLCLSPAFADERPALPEPKPAQAVDPNKDAYKRASRAVRAKTFEGAQLLLSQIDMKGITDPDVASYVALCTKIASFSADLGIPRDSGTNFTEIIKNLDYAAILKNLTAGGIPNAPAKATALLSDALKIKKQLPVYSELEDTLSERYGTSE
jgi:hypothetical protein